MKLTARLEMAEKLILDRAVPSAICAHLHAIREELEAYELEVEKLSDYKTKIADLEANNQKLLAENTEIKKPKFHMVKVRRG